MTLQYNGEELPTDLRGRALPARWDNEKREWNVLTVEETNYESNFTYCDSVDVDTTARPLSPTYKMTREILLQADPDNDHDLFIGDAKKQVMILKPGRQMTIPIDNLDKLYVKTDGIGDNKLNYFARANLLLEYTNLELRKFDIGNSYGIRIKSDGSIEGWGDGVGPMSMTKQQFIDDNGIPPEDVDTLPEFYFVPEGNDFIHVSAKNMNASALRENGTVECWSLYNDNDQISDTPSDNDFVKIESGDGFFVGLKEDGSLVSWGDDEHGIVSDLPVGNNYVDIKTSHSSAIAQKEDGSIMGWGEDGKATVLETIPLTNNITNYDFASSSYGYYVTKEGYINLWFSGYGGGETLDYTPRNSNWKKAFTSTWSGISLAIDNSDKLFIWGGRDPIGNPYKGEYIHTGYTFKSVIKNISEIIIGVTKEDKLIPIKGDPINDSVISGIPEDIYIEPEETFRFRY